MAMCTLSPVSAGECARAKAAKLLLCRKIVCCIDIERSRLAPVEMKTDEVQSFFRSAVDVVVCMNQTKRKCQWDVIRYGHCILSSVAVG